MKVLHQRSPNEFYNTNKTPGCVFHLEVVEPTIAKSNLDTVKYMSINEIGACLGKTIEIKSIKNTNETST